MSARLFSEQLCACIDSPTHIISIKTYTRMQLTGHGSLTVSNSPKNRFILPVDQYLAQSVSI